MAMNFAPYQSSPPESERAKSPPLRSPNASPKPYQTRAPPLQRNISSIADREDPWAVARDQRLPSPSQYIDDEDEDQQRQYTSSHDRYTDLEGGHSGHEGQASRGQYAGGSVFETSLGMPLKLEACLAYILLPPAGGAVLLLFEQKSDYVRFHAWQSALVFGVLFLIHIIFSWTAVISWMLFALDLLLIAYLSAGAYRNADTLDRIEVPFFGRLASSFVDDE